jgi:hypothetical protein
MVGAVIWCNMHTLQPCSRAYAYMDLQAWLQDMDAYKIAHAIHLAPGTMCTLGPLPQSLAVQSASRCPSPPGLLEVQLERSGTKRGCRQMLQRSLVLLSCVP